LSFSLFNILKVKVRQRAGEKWDKTLYNQCLTRTYPKKKVKLIISSGSR